MSKLEVPPEVFTKIAARAAELWLDGVGQNAAAKTLTDEFSTPVTRTQFVSLQNHPGFKEVILQASEEGSLRLKAKAARHDDVILSCLVSEIKGEGKDKIRAASILADILLDKNKTEEGPKQAQQISITLASDDKSISDLIKKPV